MLTELTMLYTFVHKHVGKGIICFQKEGQTQEYTMHVLFTKLN